MKILIPRRNAELKLVDELKARGLEGLVPAQTRRVRVSRRSHKLIEKTIVLFRGFVFCEAEGVDLIGLEWLNRVWTWDGRYVEVNRGEVDEFIGMAKKGPQITIRPGLKVGDELIWDVGLLKNWRVRVVEVINPKKIKVIVLGSGMAGCPITVEVD